MIMQQKVDGTRQEEVEGELSEEERWFGNSSETPSEASYGEVQENFKLSLEDRIQEQSTSPDTSLGSATPSSNAAELGSIENETVRDTLQSKEHLSPDVSSLCEEEPPGPNKPLSSNLRRLLEAGSLKLDAAVTVNGRVESPVNLGSNLSFSPPAHHAQQLSVLARKLAEKQEQSDQYNASSHFIWNQASEEEGGKPFQCPICGLVIKRKSYWKRHMVIHTGLKSHQCPLCPFRCARKDNLKSHMKTDGTVTNSLMTVTCNIELGLK
ncbi:zinc finger protein hypothetical protein [Limosa lapponica baueri]|uniref:C2H2-type domain-containing protein n=1 Tax=Limosa lapponica baueri TaxID=1758121 RepID=A0A2I0TM62_LIMLA|nr:zinc finger protein hypothetical protein [Limosa lapponica baueri]